ncbi:MAG TPA: hypothetical protein VLG76_00205 [Rhabdochlamydiaceae bacterium]|nr:hypothetical protein [Rhabdochlamydiaceae bacterium]
MIDPMQLEDAYQEFSENLRKWVPDGILAVNLSLLNDIGLLTHDKLEGNSTDNLTHLFHVIETAEKVTLYNDQFAIWIVPRVVDNLSSTLTYIALLNQNKPHLEIVFSTAGVYNTPKYILKVLQHFLMDVIDVEAIISSMGKKK